MKALAILLALLPLTLCPAPLMADWTRTGLEFHEQTPPPDPVVDRTRVATQQARRCAGSSIRFGDTAAMRGGVQADWDDQTRTLAAIAAMADSYDTASEALAATEEDGATLDSLSVLTALQFGQPVSVPTEGLAGPLLADRLFWQAMTQVPSATTATWANDILPALDAAFQADPSSFQVRAWRVIAWLQAQGFQRASCPARIADFADRLLDLSEASACPLMLGHVTHGIDRALESRPETDPDATRAAWRHFGEALLATVAGAPEVASWRGAQLTRSPDPCAPLKASELQALLRPEAAR